jgi:hypothetical protein
VRYRKLNECHLGWKENTSLIQLQCKTPLFTCKTVAGAHFLTSMYFLGIFYLSMRKVGTFSFTSPCNPTNYEQSEALSSCTKRMLDSIFMHQAYVAFYLHASSVRWISFSSIKCTSDFIFMHQAYVGFLHGHSGQWYKGTCPFTAREAKQAGITELQINLYAV